MATLGTARSPGSHPAAAGTLWRLSHSLDAYSRPEGAGLATQVAAGRHLRVLDGVQNPSARVRVRLLEDGYPFWLDLSDLLRRGEPVATAPPPRAWDRPRIQACLPAVLAFAERAMAVPNHYLWGGTLGPDFDCSGLVQMAFAHGGIWLPRDAYLQERFCRPVAVQSGQ
ncbi:MAG: C40 family peptidase, partial [Cyanobium sp.]